MIRFVWLGVILLVLSCGQQRPSLETRPPDSGSKSIDDSIPYIQIEWIQNVQDNGSAMYFVLWQSNLKITSSVELKSGDKKILIPDPQTETRLELSRADFDIFSQSQLQIIDTETNRSLVLESLPVAGLLGSAPFPPLGDRQIGNCFDPEISWDSLNPNLSVDLEIILESIGTRFTKENLRDVSPWRDGFTSGQVYSDLLSNLNQDVSDVLNIKVTRFAPELSASWLGEEDEVEIKILSTLNRDYYFFYFGDCS